TRTGRIVLGCRRHAQALQIQVLDTGPGIPANQIDHIFEEFQRGSNTETGDRGLGLGLSLADRMARLLGHTIHVRSTLDYGTVFGVDVARTEARSEPQAGPPVPRRRNDTALDALQILCIDDNPASVTALDGLLTRWGVTVT